jgi:endonuclease VIII
MPEGPEIKRAADRIARAIQHRPTTSVFFAFDHLKAYESILQGREVIAVQTRGKAMLIRFDNQLSIYSHNQLYGVWMVRSAQDYPHTARQLRLAIHNVQKSALLYSASDIAVLDEVAVMHHPFLSKLGPDVLDEATTVEQVAARFQDAKFHRRSLAALLLDQHFLCGLGNYLRSEILFVARVNPQRSLRQCTPDQVLALAKASIQIAQQSYLTGGITNDLQLVERLKAEGKRRAAYRHFVFGREQQPCYRCGTLIVKAMLAGRRLYYCPCCQAV